MELVIVSGLSGSGKSVALDMLEDLGYYCIDNIPLALLGVITPSTFHREGLNLERLAVGVDARAGADQISSFERQIRILRKRSENLRIRIIFLTSDRDAILRRYSETRRRHPLTNSNTSLIEAIDHEKSLLASIAQLADITIDTSNTNLHQLREIIAQRVESDDAERIVVLLQSFGFKYGLPLGMDLVYDVRCLPNPHWVEDLRKLTGKDQPVIDFLEESEDVHQMSDDILQFLTRWLPAYEAQNRSYISIGIGCTGGQHRSVYLTERLAKALKPEYPQLIARHRESHS